MHSDYCADCGGHVQLAASSNSIFKRLQDVALNCYNRLAKKGSYSTDDIHEYADLVQATYDVFIDAIETGIADNQLSARTKEALKNDAFLVGGMKTHAQLFEIDELFLKEGRIKSFQELAYELDKMNVKYNRNYMQAEYNFALGSAQAIARDESFIEDDEGRYLIQYSTNNGPNVRDSHDKLNGITLPKEDPFWNSYTPQNGWNCNCFTLQVLARKNTISNSEDAIKKGEKATSLIGKDGKNRLEIFRYNPANTKTVLPPKHPYRANRCSGNGKIDMSGMLGLPMIFLSAEKNKCQLDKVLKDGFLYESVGKGKVGVHFKVDEKASDFEPVKISCEFFAKQGSETRIYPKYHATLNNDEYKKVFTKLKGTPYWGKCPDMYVDGKFYEHEGFESNTNPKKALKNMLNRGLKQSPYLIIEDCGVTDSYLKRNIKDRVVLLKQDIKEVWVRKGEKLELVYKTQ